MYFENSQIFLCGTPIKALKVEILVIQVISRFKTIQARNFHTCGILNIDCSRVRLETTRFEGHLGSYVS